MKKLFLVPITICLISSVHACIWDRDTLAMERARFPEASEIIVGNFPRHSREFYEWRKAQCETVLAKDPNQPALYDDLAVAKHKLGDHRGAIETMKLKEKVAPGLYETFSNLATFYIYTGELDDAIKWIDQALALNPDAHFGREKYQKWIVEWLKAGKPQLEPQQQQEENLPALGFAQFIVARSGAKNWDDSVRKPAIVGLTGMMRFADYDNPLLLEALGDALSAGPFNENGSLLAAQAYLLGSRKAKADAEKQRLWQKMSRVGSSVDGFKPKDAMRALDAALVESLKLQAGVRKDEIAWIKAGKDASAEFQNKYLIKTK